jgi:competence protein CoiA
MLTAIRQKDSVKVLASDTEKSDAPFHCPKCRQLVILRKGLKVVHHFAHKPPVMCVFGAGETKQHREAKQAIFEALKAEPNVTDLELEKDLGVCVPDIYAKISGVAVAIEIQRSNITPQMIAQRSANYHRLGIAVLWIGLPPAQPFGDKYAPRAWEKWCHAAYFGRVYFWTAGEIIQPVHFDIFNINVELSTWYESGGVERSEGGYSRVSKRWRTPSLGAPMLINKHFVSKARPPYRSGSIDVPSFTAYLDTQRNWWKPRSR